MKHPFKMTEKEWNEFYPKQPVNCVDCARGILCPDWDQDNWCNAGIRGSEGTTK